MSDNLQNRNSRSARIVEDYGVTCSADPDQELKYWLAKDDAFKLTAVWELTLQAYFLKGVDLDESGFPRSVASFEKTQR